MKKHSPTPSKATLIGALAVAGAVLPPLTIASRGLLRPRNGKKKGLIKYPTIAVLGTAQYNGVPSRQFAGRLQWAAELWHQHKLQDVVTLGGKLPADAHTEAEVGRQYLLTTHVDRDLLHALPHGNDTRESFQALKDAIDSKTLRLEEPILIVTDPNHALRAELIARQVGLKATSSPTRYAPTQFPRKNWWRTLTHEIGGLIIVITTFLVGRPRASALENTLRTLQSTLRPSRKARHDVLRDNKEKHQE